MINYRFNREKSIQSTVDKKSSMKTIILVLKHRCFAGFYLNRWKRDLYNELERYNLTNVTEIELLEQ